MLTVVFATHNGATVLPKTLDSLVRARPPAGGWKLIAVDNASTDASAQILHDYADRLPLTVLSEPVAGKNRALNRAFEAAEGDLYVFTDDDVIFEPDCLENWRMVADANPEFSLFAGLTKPLWPEGRPNPHLSAEAVSIVFGVNEHMREGPCLAMCVLGTNMAVRAAVFSDGDFRFNVDIGPDASRNYPMGSETELARRLAQAGYRCWFAERPTVSHIIRPHQLEVVSMLQRGYRWGRGQAHMRLAHHYDPGRLSRKNRLRSGLYPLIMSFFSAPEAWARQWEWVADQGYEDGWRELRALPPRWVKPNRSPRISRRFSR